MKVHVFPSLISIVSTILISVRAKSAYDSQSKFRDDSEVKLYPVKRKTPNYEQAYYVLAQEDQPDSEYSENLHNLEGSSAQHYRRVDEPGLAPTNLQPVREYNGQPSSLFERQLDLEKQVLQNEINKRADRVAKRESDPLLVQPDETYGMVYRKGRLVGILEPYPPAFELSPLSNVREGIEEIQPLPMPTSNIRQSVEPRYSNSKLSETKSNSDWDWAKSENSRDANKFSDEKYPMILNDFKIDSKLSGNPNSYKRDNLQRSILTGLRTGSDEKTGLMYTNSPYTEKDLQFDNSAEVSKIKSTVDVKRNIPGLTDEKISILKSALDKIQNPESADKVEEIEQDLRGILNDMGLVENEGKASDLQKNKRESDSEDRSEKRQVDKEDENLEQGDNKIDIVKTSHESPKSRREIHDDSEADNEQSADQEVAENSNTLEDESKLAGGSSNLKSENDVAVESQHNGNVLGENEGNIQNKRGASKINIANYQSEGEAYIRSKRQELSTEVNDIMKGLEKSGELTVSGNKSPLAASGNCPDSTEKQTGHCSSSTSSSGQKSGLSDSKYETEVERNLQAKIDAIKEEVKREIAALQSKNAETAVNNRETQRKKRDAFTTLLDEETSDVDPQEHPEEKLLPNIRHKRNLKSIEALKRTKRGLPDFSNLKGIDTNDYFDLNGEKNGEDPDPLIDYQMDPQENKYLPQSLQGFDEENDSFSNSKEKRNTIAQQEDLTESDASDVNIDKSGDNLESSDDTVKVSEKSIENSSASDSTLLSQPSAASSTPSSEKEENQSHSLNKREDSVTVVSHSDNLQRQTSSPTTGEPQIQENNVKNENVKLVQDRQEGVASFHGDTLIKHNHVGSNGAANRDGNLEQNGKEASQDLHNENIQKREQLNSKNLIDSAVNQHFNEQLKKLRESPARNGVAENVDVVKNEIKLSDANTKGIQQEVNKMSSESGSFKMEATKNQADSSTQETKRAIRETPLKDSIPDFETKTQERTQNFKRLRSAQERRRRQVDEEENENKPQILYTRRKRANAVMLDGNIAYLPYRPEEEDVDDEGDEFEDDNFDDRTASLQKRDASYHDQFRRGSSDYDNIQDYEVPEGYSMNYYQPEQKSPLSRRYVAKMNSDVYENPSPGYYGNYLFPSGAYVRRKRQNFDQLVGLHGGGPMLHHLAAVRERNIRHLDNLKNRQKFKRSWKTTNEDSKEEPQNIADLSGEDLFGALPQSYEGELSRFKRIKRNIRNVKGKV